MASVCFTGHRIIDEPANVLCRRIEAAIEMAIQKYNVTDFYAGGAIGFDMLAAVTMIRIMEKYDYIRLHLILPCPINEMTVRWSEEDKTMLDELFYFVDSVTAISDKYYYGCMKERNQRLVDLADTLCICYWNENNYRSGTVQTVRMAKRKGLPICNLYEPI